MLSAQEPGALLRSFDRLAQRQLDERERTVAGIATRADAEKRKATVRRKIDEILGGLPQERGALKARVTGVIRADGYTIEKVIFESFPGLAVTANLYRPNAAGKYPGVAIPAGHTQEGKPEMQALAANLALKGFVALAYDPIGQGEREQTYLPELGRALSGGGGNEHIELGARAMLMGQSVARYFIFDGMRALDYLASRADVDADRLAVTGCSGGGAMTTYAGALDRRVKAAASGCHINSFRTLFTGPTPDPEMSLPRLLASGLDWADFFELAAPMPWLMLATTEDYFTPAGARPVYEEVKRWYELYGAADRVQFFVGNGPHGTPKESREAIYRFLTRWLKDGHGDVTDQAVRLYSNLRLRVTARGNVAYEPGSHKLYEVMRADFARRRQKRSVAELRAELARWGLTGAVPRAEATVGGWATREGYRVAEVQFAGLSGKLYVPAGAGRHGAVVMLEEKRLPVPLYVQRSQSTEAMAEAMVRSGRVVLEFEPRDAPEAIDGRPFLGNWLTNERADLVGENLAVLRARDIRAAVEMLAARPEVDARQISGYARGRKAMWLLMAAAVDARLSRVWVDRMPWSLGAAFEGPMSAFLFDAMVPGFALHWDVADLVAAMDGRRVFQTDPTNWMGEVVERGEGYRYRLVTEGDSGLLAEFFQ